ncbi:HD domain-containing protein [Flavobacterium panacagri]|uniref:HD domain-containing protein n=1 Tax=Flavobacterium panacagri TaxID=3034146 RepID=UPI0025A50913|nr:ATP-binding protein [Flavobacterium panacagri]
MQVQNNKLKLDSRIAIEDLILIKHLQNSEFLPEIKAVYNKVCNLLDDRIPTIFDNYTLHNTQHSFRIMEYMAKLIHDISLLDELEIVLLVYSALLHDVGMAVSQEDIDLIKSDQLVFSDIKYSSMKKVMGNDEEAALKEYVRKFHSSLSAKFIHEVLKDHFRIPDLSSQNFVGELASICESHTQNFDWLKSSLTQREIKGRYHFNSQYIACILRLADILDIDSSRTPYTLFKSINPVGQSESEWKQHFIISNTEKIEFDKVTNQKKIVFHGTSENANIHRKILSYIDWVKDELTHSMDLVNKMSSQYNLLYNPSPEINIKPNGFSFSDYKMTLDYKAISNLLMGEKIYGNKNLGLRELIQNSFDSCKVRQEIEEESYEFGNERFYPKIKIILDPIKDMVIIKDNGMGMSMEIIKDHFLNIGVSYYNSWDFKLRNFKYNPIGNYGIGFLSCFMLSDNVKVITRKFKSRHKITIELEKNNEYTSLTQIDDFNFDGTEVILNYNAFIKVFSNKFDNVHDFMKRYFLTDGVSIELINKQTQVATEIINSIRTPFSSDFVEINLSNYLKNIEGQIIIKEKKNYALKIDDLDFEGELYCYNDDDGLQKVDENTVLEMDDFIIDNNIKYMSIPLVDAEMEERFLNGIKFTDSDVNDVIEKLDRELRWIAVIVHKDFQYKIYSCIMDDDTSCLFDKLTLSDLVELGHTENCSTSIFEKEINIFEGRKNELYLPFEKGETYMYRYKDKKRKELFVRNVLIQDFLFNFPYSASIFEIESIVVNINSRNIVPNITRNDFDYVMKNELNYIIGKALHKGALDMLNLDKDQKTTLKNFIDAFYESKTDYDLD